MLIPTLIMAVLAVVLVVVGYSKGQHINGMKSAWEMIISILPMLIFAFIVAGMVGVLVPKEFLTKWIGTASGMRGILIGTVAGACAPGGPYVSLPLAAGILRSGASIGTTVSFLTAWSLWAFSRLPMEVGVMGWRFMFIRIISVAIFPPIAGLIAQSLAKIIR